MTDPDERTRRLAAEAGEDPTGWFERLYAAAEEGEAVVPWDRGGPHPLLPPWTEERALAGDGRSALVVGCGFGADAEHVAGLGFATTAFDISESAVRAARRRFPDSAVQYLTADLLDPPAGWRGAFDLVLESLTVQSLPDPPRREAIGRVARDGRARRDAAGARFGARRAGRPGRRTAVAAHPRRDRRVRSRRPGAGARRGRPRRPGAAPLAGGVPPALAPSMSRAASMWSR